MESVHLWKVAAGEGGNLFQEFINAGYVSIGFDLNVPIEMLGDADSIRKHLQQFFPAAGTLNSFVDQVFDFLHGIKEDDWVITNNPQKQIYRLGRVIGPAEFMGDKAPHKYFRKIAWETTPVPFKSVAPKTRGSIDRPLYFRSPE